LGDQLRRRWLDLKLHDKEDAQKASGLSNNVCSSLTVSVFLERLILAGTISGQGNQLDEARGGWVDGGTKQRDEVLVVEK
jgi:hypothetical protein